MAKTYRRRIRVQGKQLWSPAFTKKKEADEWYSQMKTKKQFGRHGFVLVDESNALTFIEYSAEWLQKRMQNYPKATWYSDEQRLRDYILPKIGNAPIGAIRTSQIKALLLDMTDQGLSQATRTRVRALLSVIFNAALNEDPPLIQFNPVTGIKFDERRIGKKKPSFIEDAETCINFIQKAKELGPVYLAAASLGIMAGLRKSEMLALTWGDIEFKSYVIHVRARIEQISLTRRLGTKAGDNITRDVPASPALFKILTDFRRTSKYQKDSDFVISRLSDGRFMHPTDLSRLHGAIVKASGIKVTIHGLRHTFGREFAEKSGNMRALQAILGHQSSSTTELYSELSGKRLEDFGKVVSFDVAHEKSVLPQKK